METTQTAAAQTIATRKITPWIIYVVFFSVLNETLFNVSTPAIAKQFQLLPSQVSWMVTIFIIFLGIGSVLFGKLADLYSPKYLMVIGIAIYCTGSLTGYLFQANYLAVILSRAIQGIGASAIPALVNVMLARYFPREKRGAMFGWTTSAFSAASAIGPVIGGYISSQSHWSYLFMIPFFCLIPIPVFLRNLPAERRHTGKLDIVGALLLTAGISLLILFLTELNLWFLLLSAASLVWFIVHIHRTTNPFVDPGLFANLRYVKGLIVSFCMFSSVLALMFALPLMLDDLYSFPIDKIGLILFPGAIVAAVFGKISGTLTAKKGSTVVSYWGLILLAAGFALMWLAISQWEWYVAAALVVVYAGYAISQTALSDGVAGSLPALQSGVGMGFFSLGLFISQAIGTAIVSRLMSQPGFDFSLHPFIREPSAYLYGNIVLLLLLLSIGCMALYAIKTEKGTAAQIRAKEN